MAAEAQTIDERVIWTTADDDRAFFDRQAQKLLGMSGEEFRAKLDAGEFDAVIDDGEHSNLLYLALLARVAD